MLLEQLHDNMRVNFIANSSLYFSERKYISPPYVIIPNQTCARVIFPPYRIIYPLKYENNIYVFCWNSAQFYMWAYDGNSVSIFILLNRSSILRRKCVCPLNKDRILERHIVKANHYVCESNESSSAFSAL